MEGSYSRPFSCFSLASFDSSLLSHQSGDYRWNVKMDYYLLIHGTIFHPREEIRYITTILLNTATCHLTTGTFSEKYAMCRIHHCAIKHPRVCLYKVSSTGKCLNRASWCKQEMESTWEVWACSQPKTEYGSMVDMYVYTCVGVWMFMCVCMWTSKTTSDADPQTPLTLPFFLDP